MKVCGIYKIENRINGKVYVGQSVNIHNRWIRHKNNSKKRFKSNLDYDKPLYRAMRKYGLENFEISIIKICKREELYYWEWYYIDKFDSGNSNKGYNLTDFLQVGSEFTGKLDKKSYYDLVNDLIESVILKKDLVKKYGISIQNINSINRGDTLKLDDFNYPLRTIKEHHIKRSIENKGEGIYNVVCKNCGKLFMTNYSNKIYCNRRCKIEHYNGIVETSKGINEVNSDSDNKDERGINLCNFCGKIYSDIEGGLKYCSKECFIKHKTEYIPTKEELIRLLEETPNFSMLSKKLDVADNTIRKWCMKYNLPHKTKDWSEIYLNTKGYTHNIYVSYLKLKEDEPEKLKYVLDNFNRISKYKITLVDKIIGEKMYDFIKKYYSL